MLISAHSRLEMISIGKPTSQQQQATTRFPARVNRLSSLTTSNVHGEDSPYFDGWEEYGANPYHPVDNPSGIIQMGLDENQAIAMFMEEVGGRKAKFERDRIVLTAGDVLTFCLANPGEAFLLPSPYYPGFDRDIKWHTGVELIPVHYSSSNDLQITVPTLEATYQEARARNIQVKGLLITNPSNPLGTTMEDTTLRKLLSFVFEKNIHLVCDEIYSGLVFSSPKFTSIADILATENISQREHVHIVYNLLKDLGLPGFRDGLIYSYNDTVVTAARRMSSVSLVSSEKQHLLASMLSDTEFVRKYLAENNKRLQKRHKMFVSGLRVASIPTSLISCNCLTILKLTRLDFPQLPPHVCGFN